MRGLTIEEFTEVVKFSQSHHKFAKWISDEERMQELALYPNLPEYGYNIKYIDSCYDSRDGVFWMVKFRQGRGGIVFSCNHFSATKPTPKQWKYNSLYDLCMSYLKGDFIPKDEFYVEAV